MPGGFANPAGFAESQHPATAVERRKFTKEEIVERISKYKYGNINDFNYKKEIIDTFVNSVFVYDDKLVLTYNYKDGSQTLTLQEIESALSSNLTSMCPPNKSPVLTDGAFYLVPTGYSKGRHQCAHWCKKCPVGTFLVRGRVLGT